MRQMAWIIADVGQRSGGVIARTIAALCGTLAGQRRLPAHNLRNLRFGGVFLHTSAFCGSASNAK